jgi:UDP-N-acetylmuramate dehydrogenase
MKRDFSLKDLNTFGIDVRAAQYAAFTSEQELIADLDEAEYAPWVLGGGSNVLFVDDLDRCVLKNEIGGIEIIHENKEEVIVRVGGGVVWHEFVTWCVQHDFGGIENLALIPGSVGAAPMQNIGAYGVEIVKTFISLRALRLKDGDMQIFEKSDCAFGYRDSIFKQSVKNQFCVLDIDLRLSKPPHQVYIEYGAIRETLERRSIKNPVIKDVYDTVIEIRRSKLPDPLIIGNAGSFFKNPTINEYQYKALHEVFLQMPAYITEDHQYKIPAGWLIEQCGWKGKQVGHVGCYEKQALVIVNYGGASGREVYDHAMRVKDSVKEKFDIELSMEVNVI